MPTINQLNSADSVASNDQFPIFDADSGDARKVSAQKIKDFVLTPFDVVHFTPQSEPTTASAGDMYYDSGTNKLRCYNGTIWNNLF